MGTDFYTLSAAHAQILIHVGFACRVHLHLTCTGTAAHADIFQSAAVACHLMPLEMTHGNEDIRVHDGPADLRLFDVFAAFHGDIYIVSAF